MSVDLIEDRSDDCKWARYVLSCICAYSKAPELVPLAYKKDETVKFAFKDQFVMRYGFSLVVRNDRGKEFMGVFDATMKIYKIKLITTSPYYS